jgi:hypothetical protein
VTEYYHIVLAASALQAVQVRLKGVNSEEHFILEIETVFRPYVHQDCNGVTE